MLASIRELMTFWDDSVVPYVFRKNFGDFGREEERNG